MIWKVSSQIRCFRTDEGWVLHEEVDKGDDEKGEQCKQRDRKSIRYRVETTKLHKEDAQSFFSH